MATGKWFTNKIVVRLSGCVSCIHCLIYISINISCHQCISCFIWFRRACFHQMMAGNTSLEDSQSIYHVVVVGFHHKKGCIVEYAYPPFSEEQSHNSPVVPEEWKYLPFLALPDGAHNFKEDTIYFHLPPRKSFSKETVYCVSCYRQIESHLLKKRDEDVTRGTVQKSVVVLSKMPMYGLLHAKLQLITHAYFEEKDFSQKDILKELYDHINISISRVDESQRFLGLSSRNLVLNFKHKIVMLFKLILLEKRVIFFSSPVHKLVGSILSLLSLFPRMIETGLVECTELPVCEAVEHVELSTQSCQQNNVQTISTETQTMRPTANEENMQSHPKINQLPSSEEPNDLHSGGDGPDEFVLSSLHTDIETVSNLSNVWQATSTKARNVASSIGSQLGFSIPDSSLESCEANNKNISHLNSVPDLEQDIVNDNAFLMEFDNVRLEMSLDFPEKSPSIDGFSMNREVTSNIPTELSDLNTMLETDDFGFPLSIFTRGHFCYPYASLQQHDILAKNVRCGYVVGATNVLFKTRKNLSDVVVDVETAEITFNRSDLGQILHLSAADLRFANHLVSCVIEKGNNDVFLDATSWEGGDEWIQGLFSEYLSGMLALSVKESPDTKDVHDYNESFITAWKKTKNYQIWKHGNHKVAAGAAFSHPFHGHYSFADVKLRLNHNLQSSENGRKLKGAVNTANQAVSNTGKLVGSALVSAKSSLSSWFSTRLSQNNTH